jgi:hypothetical protein
MNDGKLIVKIKAIAEHFSIDKKIHILPLPSNVGIKRNSGRKSWMKEHISFNGERALFNLDFILTNFSKV